MNQNSQIKTRTLFENIGAVKSADLELGCLTVIAGANNTGKTYIVYTLYGFRAFLQNMISVSGHRFSGTFFASLFAETIAKKNGPPPFHLPMDFDKSKDGILSISISTNDYQKFIQEVMDNLCEDFSSRIHEVFSAPEEAFADACLRQKIDFSLCGDNKNLRQKSPKFMISKSDATHEIHWSKKRITIIAEENATKSHGSFLERRESVIKGWLAEHFLAENFPEPFIFSSERFGTSLFYKELDFAKSRIVERLQNLKDEKIFNRQKQMDALISGSSARYAKPIKDNVDYDRALGSVSKRKTKIMGRVFDDIKDIIGGYYRHANDGVYFLSKKQKDKAFMIPLYLASSSARGLSGIYFYLKHIAQTNQMLIIEEPEAYLDAENQIKMARVLARCVNAGIRVLITTHSDYMLKEFNNLIMLSADFPEKKDFLRRHKEYRQENCFLKRESVRAYTCTDQDCSMHPCEIDKYGMIMPVFDNTIHKINKIANTLGGYLSEREQDAT